MWPIRVLLLSVVLGTCGDWFWCSAAEEFLEPIPAPKLAEREWNITNLAESAGLEQRQIRAIAFDSEDTVWIGTTKGIHRYDGYTYTKYGKSEGLPDLFIHCLHFDLQGRLWAATQKGIVTWNKRLNRFEPPGLPALEDLECDGIFSGLNSTLWFTGDQHGLAQLSGEQVEFFGNQPGFPQEAGLSFFEDSSGKRFLLTSEGLAQQDGEQWIRPLEDLEIEQVHGYFRSAVETLDKQLLFTTDNSLFRFDGKAWQHTDLYRTHQLITDRDGSVLSVAPVEHWADYDFAFFRWNGETFEQASAQFRLSKNWSYSQGVAPDGAVWMASYDRLIRWARQTSQWQQYDSNLRPQFEDKQGRIWFSGQAKAAVLDGEKWFEISNVSWPFLAADGTVWFHSPVGLPETLIFVEGTRVTRTPASSIGPLHTRQLVRDGAGNIWVVGDFADGRLGIASRRQGQWLATARGSPDEIERAAIGDVDSGVWWVLTSKHEADRPRVVGWIDGKQVETPDLPALPSVVEPRLHVQLLCDSQGALWLKWQSQVFRLPSRTAQEWEEVTEFVGKSLQGWSAREETTWFASGGELGNRTGMIAFKEDSWNHFEGREPSWFDRWELSSTVIGADSELFILEDGRVRRLSLPFEEAAYNGLVDQQGAVWASIRNGLLHFKSDGIAPRTQLLFAERTTYLGEPLHFEIESLKRFQADPREAVMFQRRIDERPWSEPLSLSSAVKVSQLPLGRHRISFRALDEAGNIEAEPVSVDVEILRSIWQNPWFYLGVGSLSTLALSQSYRLHSRNQRIRRAEEQLRDQRLLEKMNTELESRVAQRTEQLSEANAELREFAHSVSHDLRSPLRAMEGFSAALVEEYGQDLDANARAYLNHIITGAQRMDRLVNDLLNYSRLSRSELTLKPVQLNDAIDDALSQLAAPIQDSQATIEVDRPLPKVMGHYPTVVQILTNLISNALKFAKPGMAPRLSVRAEQINERTVRLIFEDEGIGIEQRYHEKIFSVFQRLGTVEDYEGTGIGLAIVARGCQRMGGRCGLESAAGKGSQFWIELPIAGLDRSIKQAKNS